MIELDCCSEAEHLVMHAYTIVMCKSLVCRHAYAQGEDAASWQKHATHVYTNSIRSMLLFYASHTYTCNLDRSGCSCPKVGVPSC